LDPCLFSSLLSLSLSLLITHQTSTKAPSISAIRISNAHIISKTDEKIQKRLNGIIEDEGAGLEKARV
jgi:uncharacterized protein YdeI (YjbR/CyaY-like superfamily)